MKKRFIVYPKTTRNRQNNEYGAVGEASETLNLRECDNIVKAVGAPEIITALPEGHSLVIADLRNGITNYLTYCNTRIYLCAQNDGTTTTAVNLEICRAKSPVTYAAANGDFVIISTISSTIFLHYSNGSYTALDISRAIPELAFSAGETKTLSTKVKGFALKGKYAMWQNPLVPEDVEQANSNMLQAYSQLCSQASSTGAWVEPIVVRYVVRMWDDSILFSSMPVIIGNGLQCGNDILAEVGASSNGFYAVYDTNLSIKSYGMAMSVIKGCGMEWEHLIKSIDIYYAPAGEILNGAAPLYRCETTQTGTKKYFLRFNLAHDPVTVVGERLANASRWKLISRITDIKALYNRQAKGLGINKIMDSTGGYLNKSTYIIYNRGFFSAEIDRKEFIKSTRTSARIHVPATVISHTGKCYWGGGNNTLINRHTLICNATSNFTNDRGNACVALSLHSKEGERKVVSLQYFTAGFTSLNPLLAFPFSSATEVEIKTLSAQKVHTFTCELKSDEFGEYSYFVAPDLKPILMDVDPDYDFTIPEEVNTNELFHGILRVTKESNPFVTENSLSLGDTAINAISFARKPVTSNIFGRYPMYVFTTNGIFAVSTEKGYSTPRCIDHNIVISQKHVSTTPYGEMFISNKCLHLLNGTKCSVMENGVDSVEIMWGYGFNELWSRNGSNEITVFNRDGRHYQRSEKALSFRGNCVCTAENNLLDINHENVSVIKINYLSHPFVLNQDVKEIKWNVFGNKINIVATLLGESGVSCHGETIVSVNVRGQVSNPVSMPLRTRKYRSYRINIRGEMLTDTQIHEICISPSV